VSGTRLPSAIHIAEVGDGRTIADHFSGLVPPRPKVPGVRCRELVIALFGGMVQPANRMVKIPAKMIAAPTARTRPKLSLSHNQPASAPKTIPISRIAPT
jgi:hypothetical protein